jgi:hypothetical protein
MRSGWKQRVGTSLPMCGSAGRTSFATSPACSRPLLKQLTSLGPLSGSCRRVAQPLGGWGVRPILRIFAIF